MNLGSTTNGLAAICNWPQRAAKAHYRVDELVEGCGEKHHAVRAFFARRFQNTIKQQLRKERIREVKRRLRKKELLKNIATALEYRDSANLTRAFKAMCGMSPREWMKNGSAKQKNTATHGKSVAPATRTGSALARLESTPRRSTSLSSRR